MQSLLLLLALASEPGPHIDRITPLGGQIGSTVEVEVVGKHLAGWKGVRFDTGSIEWLETLKTSPESVRGRVRIAAATALGPHRFQVVTTAGISNGRLFNANEFPGINESEPNDKPLNAQRIELRPQVIHGYMKGLADKDHFVFTAKAGERWVFDLQSIERGGFLECGLHLLDASGKELAYNEDQDEYLETPRLSYRFPKSGDYVLQLDQYRGPQGVTCGENCGYSLVVSQLPVVSGMSPLGANPGGAYRVHVTGEALETVTHAFLRRARGAEHYRLTFPYTLPLDGSDQNITDITATKVQAGSSSVEAEFLIPKTARSGLWRLWLVTSKGTAEAMSLEVDLDEQAINGVLGKGNSYPVQLEAGRPFHAWTLAAQLGLPSIDTVLELWGADGKLLAEHDDLMTGQGTVIGNPDSSLYYVPKVTQQARLTVRDRTDRTGPTYAYRLHIGHDAPGFQLLTEPGEFNVATGSEGVIQALLIKQPGFDKAVDVWLEGFPSDKAQFRADMHFGPSGDGDNINIPAMPLKVRIPSGTLPGDYPVRVLGRASDGTGPIVEAIATLWIGPNGKRNDTRRPLPGVSVHVP